MIYIYTIECPINNVPVYVGQTNNISKRRHTHFKQSVQNKKSKKEIWIDSMLSKKLIPEFKIIDKVSISESSFYEYYYIDLLNSWGFNLLNEKTSHSKGCWKNKKLPEEMRKAISESKKGEKNHFYGKKIPQDIIDKRVATLKSKNLKGVNNKLSKKIYMFDKQGVFIKSFDNAILASQEMNLNRGNISSVCSYNEDPNNSKWKVKRSTCGGYIFKFTR